MYHDLEMAGVLPTTKKTHRPTMVSCKLVLLGLVSRERPRYCKQCSMASRKSTALRWVWPLAGEDIENDRHLIISMLSSRLLGCIRWTAAEGSVSGKEAGKRTYGECLNFSLMVVDLSARR
jgi:hypothetical protein